MVNIFHVFARVIDRDAFEIFVKVLILVLSASAGIVLSR